MCVCSWLYKQPRGPCHPALFSWLQIHRCSCSAEAAASCRPLLEYLVMTRCLNGPTLGGGAFGRWLGHEGGTLMNGISALIRETPESPLTPSTMWGQQEDQGLWIRKHSLHQTESASALILDFLASKTIRNKYPVYGIFYSSPSGLGQPDKRAFTQR